MLPALTRIAALAFAVLFTTTFSPTVAVPNFPDLTIKTRETVANNVTVHTNWYFKGPRQRVEQVPESGPSKGAVIITQCDQGSYFVLNEQKKTYLQRPVEETPGKDARKLPERSADSVDIIVTTDSVDTGERRRVGSFEARRVKTIVTIDPNEEAGQQGSKVETDGWYIDLPGFNCRNDSGGRRGMIMASLSSHPVHFVFRQLGSARVGFPIDETVVSTRGTVTSINRTELMEFSEGPLDPSLFEVPANYRQTTHLFER